VRHEAALGELFAQVLGLCARAGLVRLGVVAVHGTKIAANATHHATRTYVQIAREILDEAADVDAAEDAVHGDARGDELPIELRVAGDRRKRLREAKQAFDVEREADAAPVARDRGERLHDRPSAQRPRRARHQRRPHRRPPRAPGHHAWRVVQDPARRAPQAARRARPARLRDRAPAIPRRR
jgi:hypothetical protein